MAEKNGRFLERLRETFKAEAREHIAAIAAGLGELERADAAARAPLVESAFREAHSLKAAARAVSEGEIERTCQSLESAFASLKRAGAAPTRALSGALYAAVDALSDMLAGLEGGKVAPAPGRAAQLAKAIARALGGEMPPPRAPARSAVQHAAAEPSSPDTVRLPVARLEALLRQAEEMLAVKLAALRHAMALDEAAAGFGEWRSEAGRARGAAAALERMPAARPLLEFLDWSEHRMAALESALRALGGSAAAEARGAGLRIDRLLEDSKRVLMLECRAQLEAFSKAVRDLARDQDKEVDLVIEGGELEIDRRVLEELREPLLHMLRNCVDHGIEKLAEREKRGKPGRARITLAVARKDSDKVEFTVADDGAGIALRKLAAVAAKQGLLPAERAPAAGEAELLPLLFHSGVSTSPMLTDVSGRGLGLAIVRERVERLGGSIAVESREGRGTAFRLVVPHTLATFRGIVVRAGEHRYVVPTPGVERVLRRARGDVRTLENRPALEIDGAHVPLVPLAEVLELGAGEGAAQAEGDRIVALVLATGARRAALRVDEIHGEQEVLVKPLGKCLKRVRNVAGASVLGDGRIAPVLSVHDLVRSAARAQARPAAAPTDLPKAPARQSKVLVVEDSITARGLLKNILEAAGYRVKTAVDGAEAWATLKLELFDLVLSDIEMPRMNGFDLTARIRADEKLAELPVVLVTALASREDRERGVEVGASAYIVKRDFDQDRLLEVLRRFA